MSILNINWNHVLLWTTLPVLGMYWDWITSLICERQPYVDLLKNGGAAAKKYLSSGAVALVYCIPKSTLSR
jgi:hypothetical protein